MTQGTERPTRSEGSSFAALASRASGAVLQVLVVLVVGRTMGAASLAQFLAFQGVVRVAGTAIGWGHPWYVMRSVAEHDERGAPATSRAVFHRALRALSRTVVFAGLITIPAALIAVLRGGLSAGIIVVAAGLGTIAYAYTAIAVHALKARDRQFAALTLEFSLVPGAVIAWVTATEALSSGKGILGLALTFTLATSAGAIAAILMWERDHRRVHAAISGPAAVDSPLVAAERRTLLSFGLTNIVNTVGQSLPPIVLPAVLSLQDVGRVGAAMRLTAVPGTIGVGLASVYGPRFAKFWVSGDLRSLNRAFRETQVWIVALFLPVAVVFLVIPGEVASLLGEDFGGTAGAIRILTISQLVSAASGQADTLLSMCREEMYTLKITLGSVIVGLAMALLGGAYWGVSGAAGGYAASVVLRNLGLWARARGRVLNASAASVAGGQ